MKIIKNKFSKRKFELTVIFLILLFIAMMKIVTMTASPVSADDASSVPSLFYNDTYFVYSVPGNSTFMPLEQIDGVFYVPIYLFKYLNCEMDSLDNYRDKFYIQYGNNYIIFNVSAGKTESNSDNNISCKVQFIRGTTYVPALVVADTLGLKWEYNEQYNAFRIKEAGAKRSFEDILAPHIKKIQTTAPTETTRPAPPVVIKPQPQTTVTTIDKPEITTSRSQIVVPPVTTEEPTTRRGTIINPPPPTTTAEPTTAENTREIENYLMFYDSYDYADYEYYAGEEESESLENIQNIQNGENESDNEPVKSAETDKTDKINKINEVLEILDKNEMKAVFFLSGNEIVKNTDVLRKIYASGHGLGIKFEGGKINFDAEDLISELEDANDLIYSVLKHKTRLCMFGENIENVENYENKLTKNGYYLCGKTVDILDLTSISNSNEMIDFMKRESLNVFVFDLNDLNGSYKNYIRLSSQADKAKFYINFSHMNNANIEKIKKRTASKNK